MALFTYLGADRKGKRIKGTMDAPSLEEVVNKLRYDDVLILDITEVKKDAAATKIKSEDLLIFSRQLASLISAGIPIVKSLDILAGQTEKKNFKDIILAIQKNIKSGNSLADAFSRYPRIFSPLFINMINAGEFSGNLDVMLDRLSAYLESYNALVRKVRSAMIYPIGIIVVSLLVLGTIFMFVIPGFKKIFDSLGGTLPIPTQVLIAISDFSKKYFLYVLGGGTILFFLIKKFMSTMRGVAIAEKIRSKTPVIGKLHQKTVMARFTKTLAILVRSGVPILNSLQIAGSTSGSKMLESKIIAIRDQVSRGNKLADTMKESQLFPSMVISMVGVGEEGGDLSGMLEKVSNIYEEEVAVAISGLISLLEPAIIIFLGVIIGGIAICLFLPILKIPQLISQ